MKFKEQSLCVILSGSLIVAPLAVFTGCESLPGSKSTQGAVIGGVGGAVAGAAIGHGSLLGALIGGALGAGGGYLIGTQLEKNDTSHQDEAVQASQQAQQNPAKPEDVTKSTTADLNDDGFVTMDEVVAMKKAGLSDDEMISRLQATHQVFAFRPEQRQYLRDQGVSDRVITAMENMKPPATQPNIRTDRIGTQA